MNDLQLLRKAVTDNPLEDAPLAALVDALTEAFGESPEDIDLLWEMSVRWYELHSRINAPQQTALHRSVADMALAIGPTLADRINACRLEPQQELAK